MGDVRPALWPPLILWSATILRDTLVCFAVLTAWWGALEWRHGNRVRAAALSDPPGMSAEVWLTTALFLICLHRDRPLIDDEA